MMTFLQYEVPVLTKIIEITNYNICTHYRFGHFPFPLTSYAIHSSFSVEEGKGNLIICRLDSRENYFGPVVWQNNNDSPIFQG